MTGVYLLVIVLGAATAFGLWRRSTDGRMRPVEGTSDPVRGVSEPTLHSMETGGGTPDDSEPLVIHGEPIEVAQHAGGHAADVLGPEALGSALGEQATLVQFSSAFCSPCRVTRTVLGDVAGMVPGVVHIEVDAESHLDLVRELDVTRTPTVLVLDRTGRIRSRATGAPRRADVIAALGQVV